MVESETYAFYGWKMPKNESLEYTPTGIDDELIDVCEKVYNKDDIYAILDGFYIFDYMCGDYLYFGVIVDSLDNDGNSSDFVLTEEKIQEKYKKYQEMLEQYPEIKKIFDFAINENYTASKEPQLYIILHLC